MILSDFSSSKAAPFELPEVYNVLCKADPVVRIEFLEHYLKQLEPSNNVKEKEFLQNYIHGLKEATQSTSTALKYPIKLEWREHPSSKPILLDAYVANSQKHLVWPFKAWSLVDITNPTIPFMRGTHGMVDIFNTDALESAVSVFISSNQYPSGYWTVNVLTPFGSISKSNVYSITINSPVAKNQAWNEGNPIKFAGFGCVNWTSKESKKEGYSIKNINDPELLNLRRIIGYVDKLNANQIGAEFIHAKGAIDHGVLFVEPETKEFRGLVLGYHFAAMQLVRKKESSSKISLDNLYRSIILNPVIEFSSYEDFAKKFFYRERFDEAMLRDKTQRVNLHQQPGWLTWKKETEQLEKDIDGLVVSEKGCIKGNRNDGSSFEVCGSLIKPTAQGPARAQASVQPGHTSAQPAVPVQKYAFFVEKKGKKVLLGTASLGQRLHAHHGCILNDQGIMVAGVPLPARLFKLPGA